MPSSSKTIARAFRATTAALVLTGTAVNIARADEAAPNNLPISHNGNLNMSNDTGTVHINWVCAADTGQQTIVQVTNRLAGNLKGSARSTFFVNTQRDGNRFKMNMQDITYDATQAISRIDSTAAGQIINQEGKPLDVAVNAKATHLNVDNGNYTSVERRATRQTDEADMMRLGEQRAYMVAKIVALNCVLTNGNTPKAAVVIPDPIDRNHAWVQNGNWRGEIRIGQGYTQPSGGSLIAENSRTHVTMQANSDNFYTTFLFGNNPFHNLGNFSLYNGRDSVTNYNQPGTGYSGRVVETEPGRYKDYDNGGPTEQSKPFMEVAQEMVEAAGPALKSTSDIFGLGFRGYFPEGDVSKLTPQLPEKSAASAAKPAAPAPGQ